MTFSILGRCDETDQLGIAVSCSSIAVGARCPRLQPGVGAVAMQNIVLPALGPQVLDHLACGLTPAQALDNALTRNGYGELRQLAAIDHLGRTAHFNGSETLGCHHARPGRQCVGTGNQLAGAWVVDAMVQTFEASGGQLADRLLAALEAAIDAGGEAGSVHSAALIVVGDLLWPIIDLRVDWVDEDPVGTLSRLWAAYGPQMQDDIARALAPTKAPPREGRGNG